MTAPKTLTVTESHQLLAALLCSDAPTKSFRKGIRNYCIALLMLDAGLRVGEVVALEMSDLYYGGVAVENLVVRQEVAKTKTERTIPLSSRLRDALAEYLKEHHWLTVGTQNDFIFEGNVINRPMTTRQVERIIRKAAMESIGRPVNPHALRHTFASRLMRKTNTRIVMELLGHAQMSSTQIYTHPNQEDLKKAIGELCDDPQEKHLLTTDSALDSHASNSVDTPGTNQDHR